jgi:hypothetical protein
MYLLALVSVQKYNGNAKAVVDEDISVECFNSFLQNVFAKDIRNVVVYTSEDVHPCRNRVSHFISSKVYT